MATRRILVGRYWLLLGMGLILGLLIALTWSAGPGGMLPAALAEGPTAAPQAGFSPGAAPHLHVQKGTKDNPGEGGNLTFYIQYWNDGDASAADTLITDTLSAGMTYIGDSSAFSRTGSGGGPIVWQLGDLPAGSKGEFSIFVRIAAAAGDMVTNTAQIATRDPADQGTPEEKRSTWSEEVQPNDTHLNVGAGAWTGDPAPGQDTILSVSICNKGSTGSSQAILTDTLHPLMTLQNWGSRASGWGVVVSSTRMLVLSRPSLPAGWCDEVYLRVRVDESASPGTPISHTGVITASNDLESGDNQASWEGKTNSPHTDLSIAKAWNRGQLVPGGELRYSINYANNGNVPVETILITDTLPQGTVYREAQGFKGNPLPVSLITATSDYVVWGLSRLDNGAKDGFELVLDVDSNASPGSVLTNTVEISPQPDEDSAANNLDRWVEMLYDHGPNLRVRTSRQQTKDNNQLDYEVRFENLGDEAVSNVWITDILPSFTTWSGQWKMDSYSFDPERLTTAILEDHSLQWNLSALDPGDSGRFAFIANLDDPDARPRWYTNTATITTPPGDTHPADNRAMDTVVQGEVERVELWLNPDGNSNAWGNAQPGNTVTVTTSYTQVTAWADTSCGGCWRLDDIGLVRPGDAITLRAGKGLLPVIVRIPSPFSAQADSTTDRVWGQVGGWADRQVEVHAYWAGSYQEVPTDAAGRYTAAYKDVPRGGQGYVRYVTEASYAQVIFHRPFQTTDLILRVNSGHDWAETFHEAGHTIWITLTDSSGVVEGHVHRDDRERPSMGRTDRVYHLAGAAGRPASPTLRRETGSTARWTTAAALRCGWGPSPATWTWPAT